MADEDVTLDGKPLQSLRVADLKAALEQRCLPKSGAKSALIKRLKGALMLENLQRTSTHHSGLQPNSQIGEEMSQNSFIKQYLAKQQELLRQRLEREAREAAEANESPAGPDEEEEEDHTEEVNDSPSYCPDKHHSMPSQPPLTQAGEEVGDGEPAMMKHGILGQGMMPRRPDAGQASVPQESADGTGGPGSRMQQRPSLRHEEPATPSPPRAVASLSVRVLEDAERQGLPPSMPPRSQAQEMEGTAPDDEDDRPAHSVLHLSRSARAVAGASATNRLQDDSDDDEDDDSSEEDEEEWGPAAGARRGAGVGGGRAPQPQQPSPSVPAARERSRRKLQPPQHIPPQQVVHQPPMPLRQPTPPPSPPPELSFPLPDTPKQSPPDMDEEPEAAGVAVRLLPGGLQRQDSDSSSRSSSPEPLAQRRPGPLSLLARKMASEGAFGKREEGASDSQTDPGVVSTHGDGDSSTPGARPGIGVVPVPVILSESGSQPHSLQSGTTGPIIPLTTDTHSPSEDRKQQRMEREMRQEENKRVEEEERKKQTVEKERMEKEKLAAEKERVEKEKLAAEKERVEKEKLAAEKERVEKEKLAAEKERVEKEKLAAEKERVEKEKLAAEKERVEKEKLAAEKERVEKEKLAAEKERVEKEKLAAEKEEGKSSSAVETWT
ncbi:apoptotic chromatin condensation inducer in the nucleus-like [Esox lucius]|uniref:apoptotic chromatin condensation inducer in the nucleus-like n=1 Tax=Esox lucius TaxID=8010 RepID=UPI0014774E98|nr:apoptotic chromatin condensation inducer in the nucleus-like [Esox lucius]